MDWILTGILFAVFGLGFWLGRMWDEKDEGKEK